MYNDFDLNITGSRGTLVMPSFFDTSAEIANYIKFFTKNVYLDRMNKKLYFTSYEEDSKILKISFRDILLRILIQ